MSTCVRVHWYTMSKQCGQELRALGVGPNGGMVYCMEYVAKNLDWLKAGAYTRSLLSST